MFYTYLSVHGEGGGGGGGGIPACSAGGIPACLAGLRGGGGGVVSQCALQVSRPTPRGEVEASGLGSLQAHNWGGGSPGPHQGGIPACTEADTPSEQKATAAGGRMLLECILVLFLRRFISSRATTR